MNTDEDQGVPARYHPGVHAAADVQNIARQNALEWWPAQPGIAADRFAREIVRFLKVVGGALAAAECQTVGLPINRTSLQEW